MIPKLPHSLERERAALLKHIADAFSHVTREGGVSWSEAAVIDDFGTAEDRARARALDTDTHWTELVDDPTWDPDTSYGGWSFLDPIGFRYYLPVAMIRGVNCGSSGLWSGPLTLPNDHFRLWTLNKWSALDRRQRLCVARFVRYMMLRGENDPIGFASCWRKAYESYWHDFAIGSA
jgi:hypothetical protein